MFSIQGNLGSYQVNIVDTSQLAIATNEIEITVGNARRDKRVVWLRYYRSPEGPSQDRFRIAFSNEFGQEEVHELGVLTP